MVKLPKQKHLKLSLTHVGDSLVGVGEVWLDGAEDFAEGALSLALLDDELVGSDGDGLAGPDGRCPRRDGVVAVPLRHRETSLVDRCQQFPVELAAERAPGVVEPGQVDLADLPGEVVVLAPSLGGLGGCDVDRRLGWPAQKKCFYHLGIAHVRLPMHF